jgi:hypothetical protein
VADRTDSGSESADQRHLSGIGQRLTTGIHAEAKPQTNDRRVPCQTERISSLREPSLGSEHRGMGDPEFAGYCLQGQTLTQTGAAQFIAGIRQVA